MNKKNVLTKEEEEELLGSVSGKEEIIKESSISWDGLNLLVRIPKEIAKYLGLDEKNRFEKNLKFVITEENGKVEKRFDVVERLKPKRSFRKNGKKSR